jgi:1-acyl-sn-glycerol-3-phosphate acyltransferase
MDPSAPRMFRWFRRQLRGARHTGPSDFDPEAVRETHELARRFFGDGHYFGLRADLNPVPAPPSMIVMNHSGGTTIPDVWGFGVAWYNHFGYERPLHLAAHDIVLATEATRRFFGRRGVLRGSRRLAIEVLRDWRRDLMVMPGGDKETWRPYRDRYQVRFGGRTGYARIALRCGVPIVPVAHAGAHETLIVLDDGQWLAKRVGLKRLTRASIWPVHLSLPWGLAVGPWPHIPVPATLRYRLSDPIQIQQKPIEDPPDDLVEELDRQVRAAVQANLDALRLERQPGGNHHSK